MRVVIAEDAVLLREGLARLLDEGGFDVVDRGAVRRCCVRRGTPARLCVVDVRMPPTFTDEGVRAALVIRRQWPDDRCWCSPNMSRSATHATVVWRHQPRRVPAEGSRSRRR